MKPIYGQRRRRRVVSIAGRGPQLRFPHSIVLRQLRGGQWVVCRKQKWCRKFLPAVKHGEKRITWSTAGKFFFFRGPVKRGPAPDDCDSNMVRRRPPKEPDLNGTQAVKYATDWSGTARRGLIFVGVIDVIDGNLTGDQRHLATASRDQDLGGPGLCGAMIWTRSREAR